MKRIVALLLAALLAGNAHAQKVTRIFVGFPPGQATDLIARLLAERLGPALSETVIVENKPGQGGSAVLAQLSKMPPDGQNMVLAPLASMVVNPHLYKNVGYDTLKDFEHVAMVADLPLLLVAHPSVPFNTVREMVAYAKANPDRLTHPSSGNGTLSHLGFEELKRRAGISILHVPYQGSPKAMLDLIAGSVHVAMDTVTVTQPHIQSGRMKLIAQATINRLPAFKDTPTIAEQGFRNFSLSAWLTIVVPAGTPKARVDRAAGELVKIMNTPEIGEKFNGLGALPRNMTGADLGSYVRSENTRWSAVVRESGAKVD